ncbi:efflux RND transporter periplasmic adaptor subunit [Candidatus Scalindua japonica]|nr:efflux RND transporter periplasmic adaptor subunit [Candidatus Scalindua japonica]
MRLLRILIVILLIFFQVSCKKPGTALTDTEEHVGHGKHGDHGDHEESIEIDKERINLIGLKTQVVKKKVVYQRVNATAEIQFNANKLFHISPRVKGKVDEIFADFGDEVVEGQKLALFDSIELGEARSVYLRAKTKMDITMADYEREKGLWEKKISSEKEMFNAKGEYFLAKAEFEAAENKLHLLGLSEDDIHKTTSQLHSFEHFPLLSPYNGTVIEKHITLGQMTGPEKTLFTIANLDVLWIILDIYEKDLSTIELDQKVEVYVPAFPDDKFMGKISFINHVVEEATRTVKVRVEIDNSKRMLKPGMFATAKIVTGKPEKILTVPLSALQRLEGKNVVFVEKRYGVFESYTVKTGKEFGSDIEVLHGLKEGEKVVTEGSFYLKSELLQDTLGEGHAH